MRQPSSVPSGLSGSDVTMCRLPPLFWQCIACIALVTFGLVSTTCPLTPNGKPYNFAIGLLKSEPISLPMELNYSSSINASQLGPCIRGPFYLSLKVNETLHIPSNGWVSIARGINESMRRSALNSYPNLVIGPFYSNLAMILERLGIPYLVTDYKGFDWIDMSRVEDRVPWRTLVEIQPSALEQNLAVVDFFQHKEWRSAVMVMPESSADNKECQNLADQLTRGGVSVIPYSIDPRGPKAKSKIDEVLRNVHLSVERRVIVCSPRDDRDHLIETVLRQAGQFDLLLNNDQVFMLVDPSSKLTPLAGASQMYRLGLFSATCQILAFRYVEPNKHAVSHTEEASAVDAALVTTRALQAYLGEQSDVTADFSRERYLQNLKEVHLFGRTGNIEFNEAGQRIKYKLHLYHHGGQDMYKKVAEWSADGAGPGFRMNLTGFDDHRGTTPQYGIFPETVRIVVVEEEPFVMCKQEGECVEGDVKDELEGFTIDLLRRLAEMLRFKYEVYRSPNNRYGAKVKDGTWDGMVGEILNGNATLAMGAISITSQREAVIDFSLGVIDTGVNILVPKPEEMYTIFQFLKPFSLELWMAIVGSSIAVCLIFFILDYRNPDKKFTMKETLWFGVGTLLKRGTDFSPSPISQRILSAGFTFFVLITVSTYTANMAAFLTTKNLGKSVDGFESLSIDPTIACGTVEGSATMNFLNSTQDGNKPIFQKIWNKIRQTQGLVANSSEGRRRVMQGNYAFIFDYLINQYSEMKICNTTAVASPILLQEHGIGMAQGASFKTRINIALLKLKEENFLQALKKKWFDDRRKCDKEDDSPQKPQFGLDHTAGVFLVGLFGLGFAVAFFLFKKFYLLARPLDSQTKTFANDDAAEKEKEFLCDNEKQHYVLT